jgi:hypothetical protein
MEIWYSQPVFLTQPSGLLTCEWMLWIVLSRLISPHSYQFQCRCAVKMQQANKSLCATVRRPIPDRWEVIGFSTVAILRSCSIYLARCAVACSATDAPV